MDGEPGFINKAGALWTDAASLVGPVAAPRMAVPAVSPPRPADAPRLGRKVKLVGEVCGDVAHAQAGRGPGRVPAEGCGYASFVLWVEPVDDRQHQGRMTLVG